MTASESAMPTTVLFANTLPRKAPVHRLTFRFRTNEIGLSKDLYMLIGGEEAQRVVFVRHGNAWYISRSKHPNSFNLVVSRKSKFGITSIVVTNQATVTHFRRLWHHDIDQIAYVPVVPTMQLSADEIGLDSADYPFPLYRLAIDQKTVKA